jgi:predicted protein tyrosine phosphatase
MPTLHVCSLARMPALSREIGASHLVTLINIKTPVERPDHIAHGRHLFVGVSDITNPMDGQTLPQAHHIEQLLGFVRGWDRQAPILIHCYAGVSRSTASAFITACALNPDRPEAEIATVIRALSPTATPNARFVQLADDLLGRRGRMVDAVAAIGRGEDCFEGVPFALSL